MTALVLNVQEITDRLYGEKRYGEIVITERHTVLLRCTVCAEEHRDYQKFLQHIFAHHYANEIKRDCLDDPLHAERMQNGNAEKYRKLPAMSVVATRGVPHLERQTDSESQCQQKETAEDLFECDEFSTAAHNAEEHDFNATSEKSCAAIAPAPVRYIRRAQSRMQKGQTSKGPSKCDICGTVYKDKYIMRQHRRRHSGVKPYPCTQCEMRFYTNTELKLHMPRHTGERKFVCSYCGQSYKNGPALRQHEMVHTNLRPHKCDLCDKRFRTTTTLKDHMLVHTKAQSHECSICKNRFTRRKSLMQHMKLHLDAREYVCNICNLAFNQLPALVSHRKNRHKVVTKKADNQVGPEEVELCRRCQLGFADKTALLEHHKKTHAQEDEVVTTDALEEVQSESMQVFV